MKAMVPVSFTGFSSPLLACWNASRSGPCGSMQLWSEIPPGTKPCGLGVVDTVDQAHELAHDVSCDTRGGAGRCCRPPIQRSGEDHESRCFRGARCLRRARVNTVKIEGIGRMVEADRALRGRTWRKIIFVRRIIAVPGDDNQSAEWASCVLNSEPPPISRRARSGVSLSLVARQPAVRKVAARWPGQVGSRSARAYRSVEGRRP